MINNEINNNMIRWPLKFKKDEFLLKIISEIKKAKWYVLICEQGR